MALTLLPVLNFRFLPEGEIAHDRYVYLQSVGFVLLAAMGMRKVLGAEGASHPRRAWVLQPLCLVFGAMGYDAARQSLFWSDDLTLNYRAHEIAPHNVYATTSLAAAVQQQGMEGTAMALYQQALAVQPNFWRANVNLAVPRIRAWQLSRSGALLCPGLRCRSHGRGSIPVLGHVAAAHGAF